MNFFEQLKHFFQKDIWNPPTQGPFKRIIYKFLRISISTAKNFSENNDLSKSAALTFYTLMTIIPMLAIGFGIAQYLGFETLFKNEILNQLKTQPAIAEKIIGFATLALEQTRGGIIALFGLAILLWSVFSLVLQIEQAFDEIWKTKSARTLWQNLYRYIPMILLFPVFLVGSSSLIIFISTTKAMGAIGVNKYQILPHLFNWFILSILYIYLPNTNVTWKAGILGGLIAGILYQIWQWIYITFQAYAASYGAIYGSFAAIPLFLIWLNYSWTIILLGAEISYSIQNDLRDSTPYLRGPPP